MEQRKDPTQEEVIASLQNAKDTLQRALSARNFKLEAFKFTIGVLIVLYAFNAVVLNWYFGVTSGFHVVSEYEKGVKFRLGKFRSIEEPGLHFVMPFIENVQVVKMWERVIDIPPQEVVTSDLVTLNVDGVLRYKVTDPKTAIIGIDDFGGATVEMSLTTIKEAVGEVSYEKLISERAEINDKIESIVVKKAQNWGVEIYGIEIKKVVPIGAQVQEALTKRAIARQERQARLILSSAEAEVAQNISKAASVLSSSGDAALSLRYYQTLEKFSDVKGGFIFPLDSVNNANHKRNK